MVWRLIRLPGTLEGPRQRRPSAASGHQLSVRSTATTPLGPTAGIAGPPVSTDRRWDGAAHQVRRRLQRPQTLVRQLLNDAKPGVKLPQPRAPPRPTAPRACLGRTSESAGGQLRRRLRMTLRGRWARTIQGATSDARRRYQIELPRQRRHIVVGNRHLTMREGRKASHTAISEPTTHQVVAGASKRDAARGYRFSRYG